MFKIATIVGARPQFVKAAVLSRAIAAREDLNEVMIHTGQHYDAIMSDVFFEELHIPPPAHNLGIAGGRHGEMIGRMIEGIEKILIEEDPDCLVVYGDTNSTLAGGIAGKKLGIPVAHVEAGARVYDEAMPEESNRYLTDRLASLNFCCTALGTQVLAAEGFDSDRIASKYFNHGDVMFDAALHFANQAKHPDDILPRYAVEAGDYVVCTIHRASNTDDVERLTNIVADLEDINKHKKVVFLVHPRTKKRMSEFGITPDFPIYDPVSYLELIPLVQNSAAVITDSGGLVREAYFFGKASILVLDYPLWPELEEANWCVHDTPGDGRLLRALQNIPTGSPASERTIFGDGAAGERILDSIVEFLESQAPST